MRCSAASSTYAGRVEPISVQAVTPGLRYTVDAAAADVSSQQITVYQGVLVLVHNQSFRGIFRHTDVSPLAFFVPDSLDYPDEPLSVHTEVSVRRFLSRSQAPMALGVARAVTTVIDDPRGGGRRWLHTQVDLYGYAVSELELNYRVTVAT